MDPAALALEVSALSRRRALDEATKHGDSQIQRFYAGATVLVTGGAGFLGKQLIEKLLRSSDVKKVYMLLRPKKMKTVQERLAQFLKDPVFDNLHSYKPNFVEKIMLVEGDISELRVGISEADWNTLTNEVEIIFHGAASIHFVESIKSAALTNVRGTREMLCLGKACKKLRSYVHISTAYSHATSGRVGQQVLEQFYPSPMPPDALLQLAEHVDDARMKAITPLLIGDWPNTYTFTKAVAEELVRTMAGELPVCIVRPPIVIAARSEPGPGWLDRSCMWGPSGFIYGIGLGALHVMFSNPKNRLDFAPVDMANNAALAAAWLTAEEKYEEPRIYTVTGTRHPTGATTGLIQDVLKTEARYLATDKSVWYCFGGITSNKFLYLLLTWYLHYIPALVVDAVFMVLGRSPRAFKLYRKIYNIQDVFSYFLFNSWQFSDENLLSLYKKMSPMDRVLYDFDVASLNWREQILIWLLGLRKYVERDGLNNTALGNRKQFWFRIANFIWQIVLLYTMWKLLVFVAWSVSSVYSMIKFYLVC